MSSSKGTKRISVFDRLGPGNDEQPSSSTHRRYSSDKHVGSSAAQEKGRSHAYGPTVPSPHMRMEDRDSSSIRDRKSRHRSSIGDYPSSLPTDSSAHDDKRPLNPPSSKPPRDSSEVLKSVVGGKVPRALPTVTSPESDCVESGEEGKRRKGYHSDRDSTRRSKHESSEEESSRKSGRGKDKGHGGPSGSAGGGSTGAGQHPTPSDSKSRSRREGGGTDHKRRKEEDPKTSSELGHKRKRDHGDDAHLPDSKRARHGDHHGSSGSGRDTDRHHGSVSGGSSTGKEAAGEHYGSGDRKWKQESASESSRKQQHRSRSPRTPVPPSGASGSGVEKGTRSASSKTAHKHSSSGSGSGSGRDGKEGSSKDGRKGVTQDKDRSKSGESSSRSKGADWASLSNFTSKANSKLHYQRPASVLKRFTPGAVFAGIEVSPELAGEEKYKKIVKLVKSHVQESGDEAGNRCHSHWDSVLDTGGGGGGGGSGADSAFPASPLKSIGVDWERVISPALGSCRRALTAADDYTLRRLLRKDQQRGFLDPVRSAPPSWTTSGHYAVALEFYHALPSKPSGKTAPRVQASKVGTLVL